MSAKGPSQYEEFLLRSADGSNIVDLKGKTVYLRADLNLPTINGKVTDTTRIKSILPVSYTHLTLPTKRIV